MKVKELIKELENQPQDMEVCFDYDDGYSTGEIDKISIENKWYTEDCEKVVVLKQDKNDKKI